MRPKAEQNAENEDVRPAWLTSMVRPAGRYGFVTCLKCGAALMLDPDSPINVVRLHADWHAAQIDKANDG